MVVSFARGRWKAALTMRSKAEPSCRVRFGTKREYTLNSISVLACPIWRAIHSGFSPAASHRVAAVWRIW